MGVWNPKANLLFLQATEISSPDQRVVLLDEACAGNPALRVEAEQLLRAHDDAGSFLERPLLGDQQTHDLGAETDRDDPPGASHPAHAEVSLDFLEACDVPGRLGKIGPYEVIDVIGFGGMGVVLRAHDPKLNRIVAVKVMAPAFVVNPTARKRFLREAQAAAAVTHPHVIAIHAVDQTEKTPYLVMECIDGLSLEEKIDRCGHLKVKEILRIGAQIAAGLAAAHAQGLVHRDIKPSNILLENGVERVRITDFGLARAVDDVDVTRSGDVAGTPQFMSPEQAQGKSVDHRSDLFSLGAVLYTMCTGRSPFRAETSVAVLRRVCDDVPRPIWEVNPNVPEQLVAIIDRLLAKDPAERFQTAQEVSDLLSRYLAHLQDPASTPPPEPLSIRPAMDRKTRAAGATRVGRWPRRAAMLAATVLLGLCVALAVTEATGVTHLTAAILRIATGAGTLVVEVDDPQVSITIDGEDLIITGAGPQEVRLKPGQYQVQAAKGGRLVKQELVTIERGGRQVVRVALEPFVTPPASRWLGYSLGDDPEPLMEEVSSYTNVLWLYSWLRCGESPLRAARAHGLKVILCVCTREEMDTFRKTGIDLAKRNRDVVFAVASICPNYFRISPHEVSRFAQDAKRELPGIEYWVSMGVDDVLLDYAVPLEVDTLALECINSMTPEALRSEAQTLTPKWIAKANGRPVVLICNENWREPPVSLGTFRAYGRLVNQFHLAGAIFVVYGDETFAGKVYRGFRTRTELVDEVKEIARQWGVVRPGSQRPPAGKPQ